jgi:wyosine [tRNA(Phe)-imidazoG37] synthetase (radical SAM superfamily)
VLYARCPGDCSKCPHRNLPLVYRIASRRRGESLGINLYPGRKVCSFDCLYCFRGPTAVKTLSPFDPGYPAPGDLERALELALGDSAGVRSIDFSGNGEPTLHPRLAELARVVRAAVERHGLAASVGVFTNSSTLGERRVVEALRLFDHVEAKLDTADPAKFEALNRPAAGLKLERVVESLKRFRREYGGTLAVQVMLVDAGPLSNASPGDAEALASALSGVEPDEVHVYTVYRPPWAGGVSKPERDRFEEFARVLERSGFRVKAYYE